MHTIKVPLQQAAMLVQSNKNSVVQHIRVHQDDVLFFYTEEQKAELLATFKPII